MNSLIRSSTLLASTLLIAACSTPKRHEPVDQIDLALVLSIAIAVPPKATYAAVVSPAPVMTSPGGTMGTAALSGALSGYLTGSSQSRAAGFNGRVRQQLPSVDLNREFLDALKADLQKQGYVVTEFTPKPGLTKPSLATPTPVSADSVLALKPDEIQADAVMYFVASTSYHAPGPLNAFTRAVELRVAMADPHSKALLLNRSYGYRQHFSDPFSYNTYDSLSADVEKAINGLRGALLDQVPKISEALRKNPGIP